MFYFGEEKNYQYCQQVVFINKNILSALFKGKTYKFLLLSCNQINLIMNRMALF